MYVNTGWPSSGILLKGSLNSPEDLNDIVDPQLSDSYIVGTDLYFWNGTEWVNMGRFQGPQGEPGKDAELSKAAIEAVLVGEVTTHTHDTRYYTKDQTDANIKVVADDLANNYYNKSQVDSKFTSVYVFKGSVDTIEDLPTEGNVIGDVWNVRKSDTNYAWTSEGWDALGGTAELSSLTSNGLMSKEDFAKLQGIEAGAQVNKIETITKRVLLNVVDKNVTIPEDIAISPDEPTNNEIIWMDTDEDYDFTFDGYSKVDADARFVHQVEGKDLSTNDYSNADKNKVDNLNSYVTSGSFTQDANNAAITLNIKDPVTDNNSNQILTINKATTTTAGVMSAADKTKLDAALTASDNIATATKLATARTIWGQAFDGSANVRGNISDVDDVYMNNNRSLYIKDTNGKNLSTLLINDQNVFYLGFGASSNGYSSCLDGNTILFRTATSHTERMRITPDGKVGIGTSNPTHGLEIKGNQALLGLAGIGDANKEYTYIKGSHNGNGTSFRLLEGANKILWFQYGKPDDDTYSVNISGMSASSLNKVNVKANNLTVNDNKVWHAGNDGSGSGLDADLLDGVQNGEVTAKYLNPITEAGDLNNLTKNGIYYYGESSTNIPTTWGNLLQLSNRPNPVAGTYGHWITQLVFGTNGKMYYRNDINNTDWSNWKELLTPEAMEDTLAYWYENDENNSSTTCATGGNRNVIDSLRSKFKICIAKPYGDDAALISYLNETNGNKWPDDSAVEIAISRKENRMVHFPKYYHKTIERSPGIWRTYISEQQIDSDYIEEPERLVGSFEAYKSDDNVLCSISGVESTHSQTIATFVTQAKANGSMWGIQDYRIHATIARMFCAYYKTTNISTSNSSIPCSGGTKRYNYGKTGATVPLGNKDGKVAVTNDTGYYSTNFLGLEDCYYSKWEFVQGINILKGKYVVYDGGSFPDKDVAELEAAGATNIRVVGYEPNPAATEAYNGWTKAVAQGKYGDVVPTAHGGSETTYYSDYSWFNPTGNRIFLRSGNSVDGSRCGVFMARASHASSHSWPDLGARLAFYGKIVVVDSDTFKKMQA